MRVSRILCASLVLFLAGVSSPLGAALTLPECSSDGPRIQTAQRKSLGEAVIEKLPSVPLDWKPPAVGKDISRRTLANGCVLYLKEDHSLPLVNINARFRTGSLYEADSETDVASLVATLMRTGGTVKIPYRQVDEALDFISADVTSRADQESAVITLRVPSKDLPEALRIFANIIMAPSFPQDRIDFEKEQLRQLIIRENDNPRAIANREYKKLLYGQHPYGRALDGERIKRIAREDLVVWHDKYYVPNNGWFGVTGDFMSSQLVATLEDAFATWQKRPLSLPEPRKVELVGRPGVYIVDRPGNQTAISFGHLGVDRSNPDVYALTIMNYILGGGGFSSRYEQEVRDRAGLAYAVNSAFAVDTVETGSFTSVVQTKTETTYQTLELMLKLMNQIRDEPISDAEFQGAKQSLMNGYVRTFTTLAATVDLLMNLEVTGRDRNYYADYLAKIAAVTKADVERVAKTYVKPDKLIFVLVGKSDSFADRVKAFGEVRRIDLKSSVASTL
jgi:zinc protease